MEKAVPAISMARLMSVLNIAGISDASLIESLTSEAVPMRRYGATLVIGLEGGIIQGFSVKDTENPDDLSIVVCDYDCEGSDQSEIIRFKDRQHECTAWAYEMTGDCSATGAAFVQSVLDAMDERDSRDEGDESPTESLSLVDEEITE